MGHQQWPGADNGRDSKEKTNKHRTQKIQEVEIVKTKRKTRGTKTKQTRQKTIPRTNVGSTMSWFLHWMREHWVLQAPRSFQIMNPIQPGVTEKYCVLAEEAFIDAWWFFFSMAVDSDNLQNGKPASEPWNILRCISPEVAFQVQRSRVSPGPFSPGFRIWMGGLMGTSKKC